MLNSENRLRKRKEFAYLYNNGSARHTNHLTVVYLPTKNRKLKIGFSITKKIGKAHTRNLIKRRLRAIVREFVPQLPNNYNMVIIMVIQLWMSMGVGFLSFVAGLQGVDDSLLEAGSIDGIRNRWQELWYVILPSMRPQLLFGAVTSISSAFSIGDVTANLCGMPSTDYAVHTILNHLNDYGGTRMELGYASAIATVLFFMMVISKNLFTKMLNRIGR